MRDSFGEIDLGILYTIRVALLIFYQEEHQLLCFYFDLLEKYKDKTNPEKPYYRIVTGLAPVNEEN